MTTIARKFEQYHKDNPKIFEKLVEYTRYLKYEKKRSNYGIGAVFERIRWHLDVETNDPDGWKINNNYRSRYVRLLEEQYPEFLGFYRKRKLISA